MSKVINFNAREFRLDETCTDNVGERSYQTTSLGSFEVWEIGDWSWSWTQIVSGKKLEKNTDYILRFAMTGGHCDTFDETSKVILNAKDGYDTLEAAWGDRMTYELAQSKYEPVISKRDKTGLLRVFEIPFNTAEHEEWEIRFVAMHSVARFFAAPDNTVFENLEDFTYDDWRREREQQLKNEGRYDNGFNSFDFNLDLSDILKNLGGSSFPGFLRKILGTTGAVGAGGKISANSRTFSEPEFADLLKDFGDGAVISLGSIKVNPSYSTEFYNIGGSINGAVLDLHNSELTAKAFSMIVNKLCDGCVVNMSGIKVTTEGLENMYDVGEKSDGTIFTLDGASLPQKARDLVYNKRGDGCAVYDQNLTVE